MTTADTHARNGSSWSPELLTVLGAVLAVGVGLGALIFTGLDHVRQDIQVVRADMRTMETRLRAEMHTLEKRLREDIQTIREDMQTMEGRLREDTRELRADVGQVRERVSNLEGRRAEGGASPMRHAYKSDGDGQRAQDPGQRTWCSGIPWTS